MSEKLSLILKIAIFIIIVFGIGFAIWWLFFRPLVAPPALPVEAPAAVPGKGLPPSLPAQPRPPAPPVVPTAPTPSPIAAGGPTQISTLVDSPILSPLLFSDGSTIQYYNRVDGKFYRVRPDGTIEAMSDKVFNNVSNVLWAPDRAQAILEYPDGSNILYNFNAKTQATLPRHWQQFSFSPRSDEIAFLSVGIDEDSRWLAISSPDGSNSKAIEALGENASKVQVAWSPNNQIIAFAQTGFPQGANTQEILLVGKNKENFRSLIVNGMGFSGQWSPNGEQILYNVASADNDWNPQIWIANGLPGSIGANKTSLALRTWAEKCSFSGNNVVYCAVPKNMERGIGLYPRALGNTADDIWRVDLSSGERALIATPSEDHTIERIVISADERYLYFTDKISGQLYKIQLS